MSLIILDRDGVINEDSDDYIKSLDEWRPIPGSINAIADLSKAGHTIAVATNQSGLARKFFELDTLQAMHQRLMELVAVKGGKISAIVFCPHHPDDNCDCRKPKTGLVDQIEEKLMLSAQHAFFVGDSRKDLEVALAKHCQPVLVRTGKGTATETALKNKPLASGNSVPVFDDLAGFAQHLLQQTEQQQ